MCQLDWHVEQLQAKVRTSLPEDHPRRSETPVRLASQAEGRSVLTYAAIVRGFDLFMQERNDAFVDYIGSDLTYPYGPAGISPDGLLISIIRNPMNRAVMYLSHIEGGGFVAVTDPTNPSKLTRQDLLVDTDNRIAFRAREIGEFTIKPFVSKEVIGFIDVSRQIDYSADAYGNAHPHEAVVPIGALRGGTSAAMPIFPIAAFLP